MDLLVAGARTSAFNVCKHYTFTALICLGHIPSLTIFPPGGLPWILETVRVPYDFHLLRRVVTYSTAPGGVR